MKSALPGKSTLGVEVSNVSPHGFWLLLGAEELFVSFGDFPWFRDPSIAKICDVQYPSQRRLYWPQLDVDLAIESIRDPSRFPLVSRAGV
jgi:hypothetical protein